MSRIDCDSDTFYFVSNRRLTIGRLQRQIKEMEVKAPVDNESLAEEAEAMKIHKEQLQKVKSVDLLSFPKKKKKKKKKSPPPVLLE
jgi:ssRNA-specific RNase YbeY (16S rRNA maturation enzyme)